MSAQDGTTYGTRFVFTDTGATVSSGAGDPEGVVTGSVGDLYLRLDGASGSPPEPTLYVKASGTATTTGWMGLATAS